MGKENELTFGQKASIQWNSFRKFLWNGEDKTVLGRDGSSWAQIGLFYFVFYACLAAFWAIMFVVFLQTVSDDEPKWTSYIGTPGLYQIPQPDEKYAAIRFNLNDPDTYKDYVADLEKTYNEYIKKNNEGNYTTCDEDVVRPGEREEICEFDIEEELGDLCSPPNFGYDEGKPCIFIGLNRVWGWEPMNYVTVPDVIADIHQENFITILCETYKDDNPAFLSNETKIEPEAGLSFKYFPYNGAVNDDYNDRFVSPLVAVKFELTTEKTVRLICRSYANNILPKSGLFDTSYPSQVRVDLEITS